MRRREECAGQEKGHLTTSAKGKVAFPEKKGPGVAYNKNSLSSMSTLMLCYVAT
jgi:hypothetical protein